LRGSRQIKRADTIGEQVLSMDYWEGFYASGPDTVVECTDMCQSTLGYAVYNLSSGKKLKEGTLQYGEDTCLSAVGKEISDVCPRGLTLRISDAVETPDRHAEIQRLLGEGDRFGLFRIRDLVKRLLSKGIVFFGGNIGSQDLYDGDYEGFYSFSDGCILYCRDSSDWDPSKTGCIADGAVSYWIVSPEDFGMPAEGERLYGFLRGDRFSDLAETLYKEHGRITGCVGRKGDEMFGLMMSASEGDMESAAIVSHRLRMSIHRDTES